MEIIPSISITIFILLLCLTQNAQCSSSLPEDMNTNSNRQLLMQQDNGDDLVWVVQLSDLHFSVHHPDRSRDFRDIMGPTLSLISPSLVLITGDLTDGKSKDLLTMKQDEEEWVEYQEVMQEVVKRSGLSKSAFYDLRGNHDNFGMPAIGGSSDFFSKYSLNGQLKRTGKVNSITIQTSKRKILFVGFDTTMSSGLRGPTNLFGHPTDELLSELSAELSQWDSTSDQPVTKISFGHFPLSFSASSDSGRTLKDVFLSNALSAYLCGHLHTRFGRNLKRHHQLGHNLHSNQLFQLNPHQTFSENASNHSKTIQDFWELEMGDWRKSRAMRILAVDRGQTSFIDIDFKLGVKKTIILPTFPLDSRFTSPLSQEYKCDTSEPLSCGTVRALVFSSSPIVSVVARIYDSKFANLIVVMEEDMKKISRTHGDLYVTPWNIQAFEDPSPERYLLQIEATDIMRRSSLSELRPFSVNGVHAKLSWSWKEFIVMGCQWATLYCPILWSFYYLVLSMILIPKVLLSYSRKRFTYIYFKANKGFINGITWIFLEFYNVPKVWFCLAVYLFYLVSCPWLSGLVFSDGRERGYMTYRGWVLTFNKVGKVDFLGFPDIMVVVLPHLYFVVLPSILVIVALAAERGLYYDYVLLLSINKKEDDYGSQSEAPVSSYYSKCWLRKFLLMISLAICFKHIKNCRALIKAYEMNPIIHFPLYSLVIPLLLAYTIYKTRRS